MVYKISKHIYKSFYVNKPKGMINNQVELENNSDYTISDNESMEFNT